MIVYPAIDIRGGRAVQLVEGDFDREATFDADPADAARRWADQGAEWIHIVDLDGARDGVRTNIEPIRRIRAAVSIPLQLGGGLRTIEDLRATRELGIDRLVIGSAAVTDPDLVGTALAEFGDAVAVGLDARDGKLSTHGWREQSEISAIDAARQFAASGVATIIYTDIRRDGNLAGPNLESLREFREAIDLNLIASGGIGSIDDVREVEETGANGVIIGTALYREKVALWDAIAIGQGVRR